MSLTTDEREKIAYYLGYPAYENTTDGWGYVVNQACDRITSTMQLTIVRNHIRSLERVDQLLHNTTPFAAQTFNSGASQGTTQYLPGQRTASLEREGRRVCKQLANFLQLQVYQDIYSSSGWQSSDLRRG